MSESDLRPMSSSSKGASAAAAAVAAATHNAAADRQRKQWLTAVLISSFFMGLDETIQTTALVKTGNEFDTLERIAWLGTAFYIGVVTAYMLFPTIGEIWGRKPTLLLYHASYLAGLCLASFATSMNMVIVGRALQGLGAGGSVVMLTIVIADTFTDNDRRAFFEALRHASYAIACVSAPTLGGAISDRLGWRWIYRIQIPGTLLGLVVVAYAFPNLQTFLKQDESWSKQLRSRNLPGMVCVTAATILTYTGMESGSNVSWRSPSAYVPISLSIVLYLTFATTERYHRDPFIPVHVLRNRNMLMSMLINLFCFSANLASLYYIPIFYQAVRRVTALQSGLLMIPGSIGVVILMSVAQVGMDKLGGVKRLAVVTSTCGCGSALVYALLARYDPLQIYAQSVAMFFWLSANQGLVWVSVMIMNASMKKGEDSSPGFRSMFLFRGSGTGLGIATYSAIVQSTLGARIARLDPPISDALALRLRQSLEYLKELPSHSADQVRQAYGIAVANAFIFGVSVLFCCVPFALLARPVKLVGSEDDDDKRDASRREDRRDDDIRQRLLDEADGPGYRTGDREAESP